MRVKLPAGGPLLFAAVFESCILCFAVGSGHADELDSRWNGTYDPVNEACGTPLRIEAPSVSYGGCEAQHVEQLAADGQSVAFSLPPSKSCSWANWALRLRLAPDSGPKDVVVTAYETAASMQKDLPSFECTFVKQEHP